MRSGTCATRSRASRGTTRAPSRRSSQALITRVPRLGAAIAAVLVIWAVSESLVLDVPPTVTRLGCIALALAVALPTLAIPRWPVAAAVLVGLAYLANLVSGGGAGGGGGGP